jgi:hypothetical protein
MSGQITKVYEADVRRRWSEEEKLAIVEESKTSPVARVAKKHGVAVSLLFRWRKMQGIRVRRSASPVSNGFVRLALPAPVETDDGHRGHAIEIVLGSGRRVIVGRDVDAAVLKRVIAALEA